jgi:putative transposase
MKTIRLYRLDSLSPYLFRRLKAAQVEAASVWNACCALHKEARTTHTQWPGRNELQKATKGQFALYSQSVQMVVHAFLANVQTTRELRKTQPGMKMKYPWRPKRFYPVHWPAQAVSREHGRVVLPMGRGRSSITLPLDVPQAENAPGSVHAAVDLGEIHLTAVSTNTGASLVVSGRGIRSLKRLRHQQLGKRAKKQARCQKYSRRWKKLQRAKNKMCSRLERRVRDMRHKATRQVIDFCVAQQVGSLFVGNPHGVRSRDCGRHHNQRLTLWEYGKDIDYLTHKSKQAHIMSFTGSERGTSSQCPVCGHKHKPKGREWHCKNYGFIGHRDIVGSVNMHQLAYGEPVMFPRSVTYLRPGPPRRSSRADTPQSCLGQSHEQPLVADKVPTGKGQSCYVA